MVTAVRFMCLVDRNVDSPRVVAPNGKSRKMGVSAVARKGACGVPAGIHTVVAPQLLRSRPLRCSNWKTVRWSM